MVPKLAPTLEPFILRVLGTGKPVLNVEISGEVLTRLAREGPVYPNHKGTG